MKKLKLLVYVREYLKFNYLPLFAALPAADIDYLTDFPTDGMYNIRDLFYVELAKHDPAKPTPFDLDDVILRCRLLRHIDRERAHAMAAAMYRVMDALVCKGGYEVVVGQIVDDYITHVLSLVASARGIKYIGICGSYFPGYTQISESTNGTAVNVRTVSYDEAKAVVDTIAQRNFRMDYAQPKNYSFTQHAKRVFRYQFKEAAFFLLKWYRNDKLNYHYTVQKYLAQPKRIFNYPAKNSFHKDWQTRLGQGSRRPVYLPLGVFPEATTDYWVPSTRLLNYEDAICAIAAGLGVHNQVMVKEHAHMLGIREKQLYARLRAIPNVVTIPPEVNSNALLETYKPCVLVGAGSVGVEATLRKLPVVTLSPTSYWYKASGATYVSADSNEAICEAVASAEPADVDPVEFIQQCLSSMAPFDYMLAESLQPDVLAQIRPYMTA